MKIFLSVCIIFLSSFAFGQYEFEEIKRCSCTPIKSQDRTGTCWSFSTVSFLESELIRMGHPEYDMSEMFIVRNIYKDKARNYVLRQGKANFSQGSLAHDVLRAYDMAGILPEKVYSGKVYSERHDHKEMEMILKGMLDGAIQSKKLSPLWSEAFEAVLDVYMGAAPQYYNKGDVQHTPKSYASVLPLKADDYISLTSFTHHPFYEDFILEIPDNYSNGSFYNLPIEELREVINHALKNDFSLAWDGDVSHDGFSAREGIAVLPVDGDREDLFQNPGEEVKVTQEGRQMAFESYVTTDDHLMHMMGMAKDKNGKMYYIIKNSWGEISDFKGYLYMSEAYIDMSTVAITLHKDAVPKEILAKLMGKS